MNIYEALRESHEEQRKLCDELIESDPSAHLRSRLFKSLKIELEAHAAAEERFLYCTMMMDDTGLSSSRHALSEHHEIEELLEELTTNDPAKRGWLTHAKTLREKIHHHLNEEETKFFQLSGKILTEKQKASLAKEYSKDYKRLKLKYASS